MDHHRDVSHCCNDNGSELSVSHDFSDFILIDV